MTFPVAKVPSAASVPGDLRALPGWLLWRFESPNPEKKPLKVPYYTNGSKRFEKHGSPADRAKLVTFDQALDTAATGYGLGLAMLPEWGMVGLDFDDCITDGVCRADVEALVATTYAEISPSGTGVRAFMRGTAEDRKNKAESFGFETFHAKGFLTITGNVLPICELVGAEITPLTTEVRALCAARFGAASTTTKSSTHQDDLDRATTLHVVDDSTVADFRSALHALDADDRQTWIDSGLAAKSLEQAGRDDAFEIWRDWSARSDKYDYDEAVAKWDGFSPTEITYRSVFKAAADVGWTNPKSAGADKAQPLEAPPGHRRFEAHPIAALLERPPQGYLVKGVIPRAPLVVVFGESGAGKTFLVLDLVMAVARGASWRDRRVNQGRVIYVAAEGQGGFNSRLKAYCMHHGVDGSLPFHVVTDVPNLLSDDHKALAIEIAAAGGADLIVIDTLAQVTAGGDENSAADMGKALKHCAALHRATEATVIVIAHAGKDPLAKGARGWSGVKAAADAELSVERIGDARALRVTKMKDGRDHEVFPFRLTSIAIGVDEDGDVVESAVCEADNEAPKRVEKGMGVQQRAVLEAARSCCGLAESADEEEVLQAAVEFMPAPNEGQRDRRYEIASRSLAQLVKNNWLKNANSRVSLVNE